MGGMHSVSRTDTRICFRKYGLYKVHCGLVVVNKGPFVGGGYKVTVYFWRRGPHLFEIQEKKS